MVVNKFIVNWHKNSSQSIKTLILVTGVVAILVLIYQSMNLISWNAAAVTRLLLIKLLPYWDWPKWYNAKCLISKTLSDGSENYLPVTPDASDCLLCTKIDNIDILSQPTFELMKKDYLQKGLPLLVVAANSVNPRGGDFQRILEAMLNDKVFLENDPCDLATNRVHSRFFELKEILQNILTEATTIEHQSSWFLQFRNCKFSSVKASRRFIQKPNFYPDYLGPFYTSWIIMSNDYLDIERSLTLHGLIILEQIQGDILVILSPKATCASLCDKQEILVKEGEYLVFSTDLWYLTYLFEEVTPKISLTTITETTF